MKSSFRQNCEKKENLRQGPFTPRKCCYLPAKQGHKITDKSAVSLGNVVPQLKRSPFGNGEKIFYDHCGATRRKQKILGAECKDHVS